MTRTPFEIGIYSFVELTADPVSGEMISPTRRLQNLLETIELADQVGLDVFGGTPSLGVSRFVASRDSGRGSRSHQTHSFINCGDSSQFG